MDRFSPHTPFTSFFLWWFGSLALGAWACGVTSLHAQGTTYTVKKYDTLSVIARDHGMSVTQLARYNGLHDPDRIYAGQHLIIPGQTALEVEADPAPEPDLKTKLDATSVKPNRWEYIVIHHSATVAGTLHGIDRYHREVRRMENGLAYHFLIGNGQGMRDGEIAIGRRWTDQLHGGHLSSPALNEKSLGICLIGNFEHNLPTAKQMESLKTLVSYLMDRCDLSKDSVQTHQEINTIHTRCPARYFPEETFMKALGGVD